MASASRSCPAAPSTPPSSGPAEKPSERALSISPLARASSVSPAAAGTSANSAGWPTAAAKPSSATSASTRPERVDAERQRDREGRLGERDADRAARGSRSGRRSRPRARRPARPAPTARRTRPRRRTSSRCAAARAGPAGSARGSRRAPTGRRHRRAGGGRGCVDRHGGDASRAGVRAPLGLREVAVRDAADESCACCGSGWAAVCGSRPTASRSAAARRGGRARVLAYLALHPGPHAARPARRALLAGRARRVAPARACARR